MNGFSASVPAGHGKHWEGVRILHALRAWALRVFYENLWKAGQFGRWNSGNMIERDCPAFHHYVIRVFKTLLLPSTVSIKCDDAPQMAKFPFGMTNMYLPSKIEVRLTLFACAHLPSSHSPLLALRLYRLTNALKYSRGDDQSAVLLASSKFFSCLVSVTNSYVSAAIQDIGADVSYARVSRGHFLGCRAHSFW